LVAKGVKNYRETGTEKPGIGKPVLASGFWYLIFTEILGIGKFIYIHIILFYV
jgi:hypothetical protein